MTSKGSCHCTPNMGWRVAAEDISSATRRSPHTLTPFAQVRGMELTYPKEQTDDLFAERSDS